MNGCDKVGLEICIRKLLRAISEINSDQNVCRQVHGPHHEDGHVLVLRGEEGHCLRAADRQWVHS